MTPRQQPSDPAFTGQTIVLDGPFGESIRQCLAASGYTALADAVARGIEAGRRQTVDRSRSQPL
jgi:hypothetical protein